MKRIHNLNQKLAKIAPHAALLAIAVVALFAASPMALAQCSYTFPSAVHANPGASVGPAGTINGISQTVGVETFSQSGDFTIENLQAGYNGIAVSANESINLPSSPFNVVFTGIVPYSARAGQKAHVQMMVSYFPFGGGWWNPGNWFGLVGCSTSVTVVVGDACSQAMTRYDGTSFTATWDGAHCYIEDVPTGASPFIFNNSYYVAADKSNQCLVGSWDTRNCYFMPKPPGGFLWQDNYYVKPGSGNTCSLGTFDGANCLVQSAPWGTHAFEYNSMWYFTTLFTCKDGGYDGANCYITTAPAGTTPFIYQSRFYYTE